ncbi:hypothetical protein BDY17DRAFT_42922 [Neohortaea acidophila]|uniref:Uncharacterized protein n=1 Tax=Neohortaea acidophila TaxID=245834 RepID=A0A6A6PI23_9PEZI|nr:uncharacterized protein BDY17DRAFT_42922 [Neohortaea acidophila]KAF2479659.1 hypothetical protein BDY17DRAFT_42922 [Neohortaea acidophila]
MSEMFVLPLDAEEQALLAPPQSGKRVVNHGEGDSRALPTQIVLRSDGRFALVPMTPKPDEAGYELRPANKYSLSLLRLCEKEQREYVVVKDAESCGIVFKEESQTKPQLTLDTTTEGSEGETEEVQESVESGQDCTKGPKNRKKPQRRMSWVCPRSPTPLRQEVKQEEDWDVSHVKSLGGDADAVEG